jgi:hypothetical protein
MTRSWEISDLDGTNKRRVTLAEYRAEIEAAKAKAAKVMNAVRRGDLKGTEAAQRAMKTR